MGRKRRRRTSNPAPPLADPFVEIMQDILGEMRNTVVQGVRQILMPKTPTFRVPSDGDMGAAASLRRNTMLEPDAKPAQVISIRTSK